MQNYYVYRHTSPSGKTYVGITLRNPKVKGITVIVEKLGLM